jgi:hypothetical protein
MRGDHSQIGRAVKEVAERLGKAEGQTNHTWVRRVFPLLHRLLWNYLSGIKVMERISHYLATSAGEIFTFGNFSVPVH